MAKRNPISETARGMAEQIVQMTDDLHRGRAASPSKLGIANCIVVSDLHLGCQLGLCPPEGVRLDNNGRYKPNEIQQVVWGYWREFWDTWVPAATHNEPYCVVVNGDLVDGDHHHNTAIVSGNPNVQRELAELVLSDISQRCKGRMYVVRGTPAHSGESARDEEAVAKGIQSIPDRQGRYARPELWLNVGRGLVHFLHHVGTTSSSAHESSAVNAELSAEWVEAARWGERPPDIIARSHRHRNLEIRLPNSRGYGIAFVTAGWQGKTPFTYKVAGGRVAPPQFGGSLIRDDGVELYTRHRVWSVKRDEPEDGYGAA